MYINYLDRINIDFEDLPEYAVHDGILKVYVPLHAMQVNPSGTAMLLAECLQTLTPALHTKLLKKGIEYAQKAKDYHLEHEYEKSQGILAEAWEKRIAIAEHTLAELRERQINSRSTAEDNGTTTNKDFTTARQVLAIHYLLDYCGVANIDLTQKARFIQFFTGREAGATNIINTTIYKKVKKPLSADDKTLKKDLAFIREYFENLGLHAIAAKITKEIASSE